MEQEAQFTWLGKNTIKHSSGMTLSCFGLFTYCVKSADGSKECFLTSFLSSPPEKKVTIYELMPPQWMLASSPVTTEKESQEIFEIITEGFKFRGLALAIVDLSKHIAPSEHEYIQLLYSVPLLAAAQKVTEYSKSEEMSDDERAILWNEVLEQVNRANSL